MGRDETGSGALARDCRMLLDVTVAKTCSPYRLPNYDSRRPEYTAEMRHYVLIPQQNDHQGFGCCAVSAEAAVAYRRSLE